MYNVLRNNSLQINEILERGNQDFNLRNFSAFLRLGISFTDYGLGADISKTLTTLILNLYRLVLFLSICI